MLQTGQAGVGVIRRDSNGHVVFSVSRCGNAPVVEALACVEGLRLSVHGGLSRIIVETDCARIYSAMESNMKDMSEVGFIIDEAKGLTRLLYEGKCPSKERL